MARTILDWLEESERFDLAGFLRRHPYPFLVPERIPRLDSSSGTGFRTVRQDKAALARGLEVTRQLGELEVHPVTCRETGGFTGVVSLGRSASNDIVLALPGISKFHAYFSKDPADDRTMLTDAGSTNGTFVGGQALPARIPVAVSDGDRVEFGRQTSFVVRSAESFRLLLGEIGGEG